MNRRTTGTNIATLGAAFALAMLGEASAQTCPTEVAQAKAALERVAGSTEAQLPRTAAGAKQEIQSPRGEEVQSPRGQEVQSPRGQEIQSPRGQEVQSPRAMAGSKAAEASDKAAALIKEAEAACSTGDMTLASQKAKAALEVLK